MVTDLLGEIEQLKANNYVNLETFLKENTDKAIKREVQIKKPKKLDSLRYTRLDAKPYLIRSGILIANGDGKLSWKK